MTKFTIGLNILVLFLKQVILSQDQPTPNNSDKTNNFFHQTSFFTPSINYIGDFASNLSGGKKTGSVYLGMANIKLGFETKNIGLWDGGDFFINGAATHGETPSEKLFGDFQVASNIEAGNHTYLQEFWYKHSFNSFQVTLGLQDLNAEFVTSETAGSFINSSFGIPSLISGNIPVPLFPLTALGVSGKLEINECLALQAALFDGLPEDFENNQHNINWSLNKNNGALIIAELQFATSVKDLPGTYKVGYYYHSTLKETSAETGITETVFNKNYGFYLIADQTLFKTDANRNFGLFAQLGFSPSSISNHNFYMGTGITYNGILDNCGHDKIGLALAHAGFYKSTKYETTIEFFYKTIISEIFFIQPDVQYIINPSGTDINLNNALAALIRFGINF